MKIDYDAWGNLKCPECRKRAMVESKLNPRKFVCKNCNHIVEI
jgi:transposase-like protein